MPAAATTRTSVGYFRASREPRYSLIFALPLLVLYELLAAGLQGANGGIRNGADVMLKSLLASVAGARGPMIVEVALIGGMLGLAWRDARRSPGRLRGNVFAGMMIESALLAGALGTVVGLVTAQLVSAVSPAGLAIGPLDKLGVPAAVTMSLGAGLYEELVFRVVLVGALIGLGKHLLGWGPAASSIFAILGGATVFSLFHYIGPFGDSFTLATFVFRTVAGLAFSGLYVTRGFGITAWTHALYDIFLVMARG
jgi:membrane protease YdiL (CAAX protease family)